MMKIHGKTNNHRTLTHTHRMWKDIIRKVERIIKRKLRFIEKIGQEWQPLNTIYHHIKSRWKIGQTYDVRTYVHITFKMNGMDGTVDRWYCEKPTCDELKSGDSSTLLSFGQTVLFRRIHISFDNRQQHNRHDTIRSNHIRRTVIPPPSPAIKNRNFFFHIRAHETYCMNNITKFVNTRVEMIYIYI